MRKQLFLFFMGTLICTSLHGMDSNSNNLCKEIVICNVHPDMHRTLARLNTTYNKIIEDNHRLNKKRIEYLMKEKDTPITRGDVVWNKDFSQCAWATVVERDGIFDPQELKITRVDLNKEDIIVTEGVWYGYIKPAVGNDLSVFFNRYGAACCHGYGNVKISENSNLDEFIECSLKRNGQPECRRCVVWMDRDLFHMEYSLKTVLHIPAVMKAFLNSSYKYRGGAFGDIVKVYKPSKVILPEEYKKYLDSQIWYDYERSSSYHDDCTGYYNF